MEITYENRQILRQIKSEQKRLAIDAASLGERKCKECGCYLDCYTPNCKLCRARRCKNRKKAA